MSDYSNEDPGLLPGVFLFVLLLGLGQLALALTQSNRDNLPFQNRLFLYAALIRFAGSLALYQFGLVDVLRDEDAAGWVIGRALREAWIEEGLGLGDLPLILSRGFEANNRGYYFGLGVLFFVLDSPYRLVAAAVNCVVGAFITVFVYRTARVLFNANVARRAGWLACFFPALVIWSAQTIKEPVVILLEVVALYSCVRLKQSGFAARYVATTALAVVLMIPLRFYAAYVAVLAIIAAFAVPRTDAGGRSRGSMVGVWVLLVPVLVFTAYFVQKEANIERYDLKYIEQFRYHSAKDQGSGVYLDVDLASPTGMGQALVVGALHLLLAPFPWQLAGGSLRMLLVGPEVLLWYVVFFAGVIPGLRYALRHRFNDMLPLLCFVVCLGLLYSVTFANVGLVYRQRAQLLPYLLIFGAVGLELRALRRRPKVKAGAVGSGRAVPAKRPAAANPQAG